MNLYRLELKRVCKTRMTAILLAIALVLVPGQSFWNVLRSWLFGTFGVVTYFVGPFLLYLAYLLASGYHVGTFIGKVLLLAGVLARAAGGRAGFGRYGGHLLGL